MKSFILLILVNLLFAQASMADSCKFQYWEVIPQTVNCPTFYLPDFEFSAIPYDKDTQEHIKRFCTQYEIHSKYGSQKTGYCYTGEGDRSGPHFRLGDETANASTLLNGDRVYLADLNFEGCVKSEKQKGIMFVVGDWRNAPKEIKRFWPLEKPGETACAR